MPKGNNAIPHVHQRKHFNPCSSQKGNIKVFLNQPAQKIRRRRLRLLKAKRIFPRPLRSLRPQVNCPTIRHNMKKRLGRGFTAEELQAVGLKPRYAATIGIRVDHRRKNKSEEGMGINIQRLKTYMDKLVLFPLRRGATPAAGESQENPKSFSQERHRAGIAALSQMVVAQPEPMRVVTKEESEKQVYRFLKKNHSAVRFMGARMARAKIRAEKASAKK